MPKPIRPRSERRHFDPGPAPKIREHPAALSASGCRELGPRGAHGFGEIRPGKLYKTGRAICGHCTRKVYRVTGGKRRRKEEGWLYTLALGWLCEGCSSWAKRGSAPPPEANGQPFQPGTLRSPGRHTGPKTSNRTGIAAIREMLRPGADSAPTSNSLVPLPANESGGLRAAQTKPAQARHSTERPECRVVANVEKTDFSTRSGRGYLDGRGTVQEQEARAAALPKMAHAGASISLAKLRKIRRVANRKANKARGAGDLHTPVRHDTMTSTEWVEFTRRKRRS